MKRKSGKPKRRKAGMLSIFLLLLVVLCICGFLGYRFLRVEEIVVVGNRMVEEGSIEARAAIEYGTHLLTINKKEIKARIEEDPYLSVEEISFRLPDTVVIRVQERTVEAVIQYMERAIFIDREGKVLDIRADADLTGILVVKGIAVSGCATGERLAVYDEYQLEALEVLLETLVETGQYSRYGEADFTNVMDIGLVTHEGMLVRIGQVHDLEKKLFLADSVIAELNGQGIRQGTLSVTDSASAAFAPVPTPAPVPEPEEEPDAPSSEDEGEPQE